VLYPSRSKSITAVRYHWTDSSGQYSLCGNRDPLVRT
jgi:hypothetical protein